MDSERLIAEHELDTVAVAFADPYGRLMGKRVPAAVYLERLRDGGLHVCDYLLCADIELEPLPGFAFSSWESGYGDMVLQPDRGTLRCTPWLPGSALVLCDVVDHQGQPVTVAPRQVLRRQLERLAERGLQPQMASELEFYTFRGSYREIADRGHRDLEPTTSYIVDYHLLGTSPDEALMHALREQMPEAGVPIESSKGEWGRGQHEVNLVYCDALTMADRHLVFKEGTKLLAQQHGVSATFMAKVATDMAGSSCHIHTSLVDAHGRNAFWDEAAGAPSALFGHFLAGCMAHARELGWFFAPLVNSYKRYQATSFAPTRVVWGEDNRTCGFRVVGHGQNLRIENRIPGADVNPYLAYAATLAAGLAGIEAAREPPPPVRDNAYTDAAGGEQVSATFQEAIAALRDSRLARTAFGEEVWQHYLHFAECEQAACERWISDWEIQRYFERI
jgi:glutamine synthetase